MEAVKRKRRFRLGAACMTCGSAMVLASAAAYLFWLPDVGTLALENPKTTAYIQHYVRLTTAKGKKPVVLMRWMPLSDISEHLRRAVVVAEDDSFYRHGGVDWDALEKAYEYNRKKGRFLRGASTITQQLARNLYLSPERSALRKIKEIAIAYKLEQALTKDRILELYLNVAEWGRGVYGAQAASQIYFGKNASELTPDEAAALAAALPSPWRRNPSLIPVEPTLARKKDVILERMRREGYLPPGVSIGEIDVPGTPDSAATQKKESEIPPPSAPCATTGSSSSPNQIDSKTAPRMEEPADSCGPPKPKSLF